MRAAGATGRGSRTTDLLVQRLWTMRLEVALGCYPVISPFSGAFKILFSALFVVGLAIVPARAQATRTWVSGVGDDANPCGRTAPCKTWAGAISKTSPGGEMDALDPGGFGALTITKSITIDGGGGQVASVLTEGTPGITIAAASNDVVIIRNLRFDGLLGNGSSPVVISRRVDK
jgi:hypothetical protein